MNNKEEFTNERDYQNSERLTEEEANKMAMLFNDSLMTIPRSEVTFLRKFIDTSGEEVTVLNRYIFGTPEILKEGDKVMVNKKAFN
jgi:hypothetical protein